MRAITATFRTPKDGSSWQEYEDAAAVGPGRSGAASGGFEGPWLAAAVADGASEALLARQWANELVGQFTDADPAEGLADGILAAAGRWDFIEANYVQLREEQGEPIAWYEDRGLEQGSYATIVGARLLPSTTGEDGALLAWALGDACLFHIRADTLIAAFPIDDPAEFNTSPALAPSRPKEPAAIAKHVAHLSSTWQRGDIIHLASDALACWFLTQAAAGGSPWRTVLSLETDNDFDAWVQDLRAGKALRNDDTTLLRIDIQ